MSSVLIPSKLMPHVARGTKSRPGSSSLLLHHYPVSFPPPDRHKATYFDAKIDDDVPLPSVEKFCFGPFLLQGHRHTEAICFSREHGRDPDDGAQHGLRKACFSSRNVSPVRHAVSIPGC
jgi:hypothetical protein